MKKTIAIDMDGVLADIEVQFLDWYEKLYGIRFSKEDIHGKHEEEAFPVKDAIRQFVFSPGFFRTIPVMEGAVEAVKWLMENYEVYIVTAAMEFPLSLSEKYDWLKEHFPFIHWKNIIFCGNKSVIHTDYLIDDYCKNLDFCAGKPILFSAFHNTAVDHHVRVNNWTEVIELFKSEEVPA